MNIVVDKLYLSNKNIGDNLHFGTNFRDKLHPFDRYDASDEEKCIVCLIPGWRSK